MPYAIVMHIEKTAAARIVALWNVLTERDDVGRIKFSDEQIRFNDPPHVTLAVVDTVDPDVNCGGARSTVGSANAEKLRAAGVAVASSRLP